MKNIFLLVVLFIIVAFFNVNAQWTDNLQNNTPICIANNLQFRLQIIKDMNDNCYLFWADFRSGNGQIYGQKLNINGLSEWQQNGKIISNQGREVDAALNMNDSANYFYILFQNTDFSETLEKMDLNGNKLFGNNGVIITSALNAQWFNMVADGKGGIIVTWEDERNGNFDIFAQRVNSNGNISWTSGGVVICDTVEDQYDPEITSDGKSGAIITWDDYRNKNYDIYAQRIDSAGQVLWAKNGVLLGNTTGFLSYPRIVQNSNGGAYITFYEYAGGVFLNKIESDGSLPWGINGKIVVQNSNTNDANPKIIRNSKGMIYIIWFDGRNGTTDLYAQRYDEFGNSKWTNGGIKVASESSNYWNFRTFNNTDDYGFYFISCLNNPNTSKDLYIQKVDSLGNLVWGNKGKVLTNAIGDQQYPVMCLLTNSIVSAWVDTRNDTSGDIYAQEIYKDGSYPVGLLPTVTTNAATNKTQTSSTLNGTVNPNGLSTTVKFVYGLTTSYGDTAIAIPNPVSGNSNVNVTANISNLTAGQTYHYKLIALSSAGTASGADSTFQTSSIASNKPTATTNSAENIAQTTATLGGTVNPNGVSTTIQFDYGTAPSYGNTVTASQSPVTGNNNVTVSAAISGLTQNTYYHYRVMATNSVGTSYGSDMTFKTKFYYPTSISLTQSYSFGDPSKSTSYKLIGLPGNLNIALSQMFGGTPKQDWDAYYDNGNTTYNYLVEYDNSLTFTFKPGNGFWIISKNPINISQDVSTVTLNSNNSYSILLRSGWNIISNPFDKSVVWDSVVAINTITLNPYIYAWNAGWDSSYYSFTTFAPYKGYYFYNAPENHLSSLEIPYNPNGVAGKKLGKISSLFSIHGSQSLKLSLDTNKKEKSFVVITIDSTSSNDFDAKDILSPPSDFEDVGINILDKSISLSYKKLLKESRPSIEEGQTFNVQIKNTLNQRAYLQVTGQNNFEGYNIYVMDSLNHKFYNLKQQNNIPIIPSKNIENYKVLIGDNQFIETKEKEMLPKNFWLSQNYPNPFNPTTTIEYSVPQESNVTLRVYDITGRLIRTLVNEERAPGYYEVSFNGENLASGVYFYRIEAQSKASGKSFAKAGKMVLLK